MSFEHIELWTDGSIAKNPAGAGGLGILLIAGRIDLAMVVGFYIPQDEVNTNNRMELLALIEGMKLIKGKAMVIHFYTDSKYVIGGMKAGGYETNGDLWKDYNDLLSSNSFYISPNFVKGHNGNTKNMLVDKLASGCRINMGNIKDRGTVRDIMEKHR